MTPLTLMSRVLGGMFTGASWALWKLVLAVAWGQASTLTQDERERVKAVTGRSVYPSRPVRELWLLLGRRSGKSVISALIAVWATTCRTYTLAPGEVGVYMVIAADRKQARIVKRYIAGMLRFHPSLETLIERETDEAIWLTNGLCIEISTCSFQTVRGYTCIGASCDEVAFWSTEDSKNPDHEVLVALRAAMASVPEAMLVCLTSTYARHGEAWRAFETYYGKDDSEDILVVNGSTSLFNATISQRVIEQAYQDDPVAAAAEYGAGWRRDVETFVSPEAVKAVTVTGRLFVRPVLGTRYFAFDDPAGGGGNDAYTFGIAHNESGRAVLDYIDGVQPPFDPEAAVGDFAAICREYGVKVVYADRWGGEWVSGRWRQHGIEHRASERTKSEIYAALLPLVMGGRVELLDHPRMLGQLCALERKTTRNGKDSIDHPPGPRQHDDYINAAAGAVTMATAESRLTAGCAHIEWLI